MEKTTTRNIALTNFEKIMLAKRFQFLNDNGEVIGLTGPEDFYQMTIINKTKEVFDEDGSTYNVRTKFLSVNGIFLHPNSKKGSLGAYVTIVVQDDKKIWLQIEKKLPKGEYAPRDENGYNLNSSIISGEENIKFILSNLKESTVSEETLKKESDFLSSLI